MQLRDAKTCIWDVDPVSTLIQKTNYRILNKGLKSISVLSEHRFEGKTTVAMLLARGLSEVYNQKILYIDMNPRGDFLLNQYLDHFEFQEGFSKGHPFKFDILRLKNLEFDWKKNIFDSLYLDQVVTKLSEHYDLVVVDTMSTGKMGDYPLMVNTQSNVVVASKATFETNGLRTFLLKERKDVLGVIFNK